MKVEVGFTGGIMIGLEEDCYQNSDFIESIFSGYSSVYELIFRGGKLVKKYSMMKMIQEFKKIEESLNRDTYGITARKCIDENCNVKYESNSYKWK